MQLFVMSLWIITLLAGAYLWSYTAGIGRPESVARATTLPRWILFVHPTLALTGIAIWAVYSAYGGAWLVWAALVDLLLVAALGAVLALRTHKSRRELASTGAAAHHGGARTAVLAPPERRRVEDQMPSIAILTHGLLAGGLIVAVLVEAVRVTW